MSKYPKAYDLFELKQNAATHNDPNGDFVMAEDINELQDSILAIQQTIGKNPQGRKQTVASRLDELDDVSLLSVPSLLYYLGDPLTINGATTIEESVLEYLQHKHVIIGKEIHSSHESIIARTKHSGDVKFYGYIDVGIDTNNLSIEEIQTLIIRWKRTGVDGIFCANMGYDKGVTRERQNTILDSIHEQELIAFMESANPNDVLSDTYHETANPDWALSKVRLDDIYLYTSFAVEATDYADVLALKEIMEALQEYRETLDIQVFGVGFPRTTQDYRYAHGMALLWSLDAFGASQIGYGETDNLKPHFDWVPLVGQWYSKEITIKEEDGVLSRKTGFGVISVDTKEHLVQMKGIQIPFELLDLPQDGIDGRLIKDASISSEKITHIGGTRIIDEINTSATNRISLSRIDPITLNILAGQINIDQVIGDIDTGRLIGDIAEDLLLANVIGAINAYIGEAQINSAKIVDLDASKITTGTLEAERISSSVIEALELYATKMEVDSATIDNAVIGELEARHISANVIEAINLEAQTAQIKEARIADLNAEKIVAGDIAAERLRANTISAINMYAETITAEEAKINSAAIGELTADRITANVVEAINIYAQNLGTYATPINKAIIESLEADDIKAIVFEAIEANITNAKINSAFISDLTADQIRAIVIDAINIRADDAVINSGRIQELTADKIKGSVIEAINLNARLATIDSAVIPELTSSHITTAVIEAINADIQTAQIKEARIGNLSAEKITTGTLKAEVMEANVITAIDSYVQNTTANRATINTAAIGTLAVDNMQANVISAINGTFNNLNIDKGKIGQLDADNIEAGSITTEKLYAEAVTTEKIKAGAITTNLIEAGAVKANQIYAGAVTTEKIYANAITAEKLAVNSVVADKIQSDAIVARHIKAGEIVAGKLAADSVVATNIKANAIESKHILAGAITASKIDAQAITVDLLKANVVQAVNASIDRLGASHATIEAAAIGSLTARNIQAEIIKAINASIEEATIDAAQIGALKAEHIVAEVIKAINLSVESAKIRSAQIEDLNADKITAGNIQTELLVANVVKAINSELQTAIIQSAKIEDLHAGKIVAGDIHTDRLQANVVSAINATIDTISGRHALIDSAAISVLSVDHMQAKVISAINASVERIDGRLAVIDNAKIGVLKADHIETAVIEALEANVGKATINQALISELTADKIKAGNLSADVMMTNVISAINGDFNNVTIQAARIGVLEADNMQANVISAINGNLNNATIDKGRIGQLDAGNIEAGAITTEKLAADSITADKIAADEITAKHLATNSVTAKVIEANAVTADKIAADAVTAGKIKAGEISSDHVVTTGLSAAVIKFGTMSGERIQTNTITASHIQGDTATISRIISGNIQASDINAGQITGEHIKALSIETKHFSAQGISGEIIRGDSIHGSKIIAGTLSAGNLQAGSITSVEIAAQTIQTRNLAAGAVDAKILRAGTISAEHISTIGLDANLIEVFGTNGQTLIGDGYLKVDGLDVGVVQSDNLVGNGLFLSGSSAYGYLRDNPSGEAVLGNQSILPGSHQVWRFNVITGDKIEIDTGGSKPVAIDIDTENKHAYVTLQGENKIVQLFIDEGRAASRTGKELPVGIGPGKMYFTGDKLGDHKHFFVLNTDPKDVNIPDSLTIFDAPPNSIGGDLYVHHMIPLGNTPWDMIIRTDMDSETPGHDDGDDHGHGHMMSVDDRELGDHNHHTGHSMTTYITLAGSGDVAVIDMTSPESMSWTVNRTIPITAFGTDNYHGGLDGRFGLGEATGGDSSAPFSDLSQAGMAGHAHAAGGYATSDGTMRTYAPHGIALSQDPEHIYVTDYSNGHLVIVDTEGKAAYNSLSGTRQPGTRGGEGNTGGGGMHPHAISEEEDLFSIQAGGGHNHGGGFGEGSIRVPGFEGIISQEEQTTRWVRYRIPVGTSPESVQIIHGKIFVTNEGSSTISILDEQQILDEIATDREFYKTWNNQKEMRPIPTWNIREIHVGSRPTEMKVDPSGDYIYVTINGQNQIAKIDVATEQVIQRFPTGPNPKGTAISPDGVYLYVANHGGSGNLSFVYPAGNYIGDAYLGLEGGVEFHGAEHWVPNRSDWIYEMPDGSTTTSGVAGGRVRSAATVEFRINEPFLNEGGYTRLNLFGVDNQWAVIEQDIFNVVNYSNGSNVAIATEETLKQDASLIRYWPKNEWLKEYHIRNITIFAKSDEVLRRVEDDPRTFRPSKNWIGDPERPVILVGLPGTYSEVSENNYVITYGEDAKIIFNMAIPYDQEVYCTSYYYSERPTPDKYTIYYEDDYETSAAGTTYAGSHIKFIEGYLPKQNWIEADYTFRHNRWFRNHNGSVQIATENSSSENFYVQFEVDEFVPKFVTVDNLQTESFEYWPIEVPSRTNKDYTGLVYSNTTNRAIGAVVTASAIPISGSLASIVDGAEPMSEGGDGHMHMHMVDAPIFKPMHSFGETVVFPEGLQHVVVDLGATFMIGDVHITHAFHENRQYHQTKTEVSEDRIHWYTIFDSALDGEYLESRYDASTGATHYGLHHHFHTRPVRYIRDWSNGYTEYQKNGTNTANWTQTVLVGKFKQNHWTEIMALGDWEFENEFSRSYTDELLNKDIKRTSESFVRGNITSSGPIELGADNERDITRVVNKNLLFNNYYTPSGVLQNGVWTYPAQTASITIDLGSVQQVDTVRIWRYYADGRTHHDVKTEISVDGRAWTTVYDSKVNGEYSETPKGNIISLGGIQSVRYIRDSAKGWTALLKSGTTLRGNDVRWVGAHAYLGYNPGYLYTYQSGSELEGQNLATNGRGVVTTMVPKARIEMDIKIDFTSWWYMTYIVGPEFGQLDVQMPTVMGGSHSMFQDSPYLNKIAHRHIMSWPTSINIKEDSASGIKAGQHKMVLEHISGKVSLDRLRFEDYQYLYKNSTEIPKGNATNFIRYKIEPDVGRWYVGRGNQSTEGAYDVVRMNTDTGKPDGSVSLKYRFRIRTSLQPQTLREERGIAYVTSAIFETGRLSSHWRMSEGQDSFPGNRIEVWDPNQPHKTGIQGHHLANGSVQGNKIMPLTVMNHHISNYARIAESKLNLNHPTHEHGHIMTMADGTKMWMDNKSVIDSIHGWGTSGTRNVMARADHDHDERYMQLGGNGSISSLTITGDLTILGKVDGIDLSDFKSLYDSHVGAGGSVHALATTSVAGFMSGAQVTKLNGIATGATKVASSTNGKIKINDVDTTVYTHPTGDGNLHVPVTSTINNGKFLKAGTTAGAISWQALAFTDVGGVITDAQHGNRSGGSLHALATTSLHGFMSSVDKDKLNKIEASAINQTTADGRYLRLTGGTISNDLIVDKGAGYKATLTDNTLVFGRTTTAVVGNANGPLRLTASNTTLLDLTSTSAKFYKSLDVVGNITLSGTVDGVDIANFKTAYDGYTAIADPPTNLVLVEKGNVVEITFTRPSSAGVSAFEVWYSKDNLSYKLVHSISSGNINYSANTVTLLHTAYESIGTAYYKVYSVKNGNYSSGLSGNINLVDRVVDPANLEVIEDFHTFTIQYETPADTRLSHVEIWVDRNEVETSLARNRAEKVYSGNANRYVYPIAVSDYNSYHQFWVESVTRRS